MAGNTDNPNNDIPVQQPPNDSISSLIFSPTGSFMAAGSWSKEVRFWEVGPQGQTAPKAMKAFGGPILSIDFSPDGQNIFAAGCDKTVQLWNVAQNQASVVAQHDAPIKFCKYVAEGDFLVTGSWDKTVRFWDLRQRKCAAVVQLPERVYAMDVTAPLLTMAMAGRQIAFFDSRNPSAPVRKSDSPLKMQSRCVANFPSSRDGCALGSIEGRVAIHHVEDKSKRNFSFKCHRQDNNTVFAVNAICFHPYGTFATAGSDGGYTFWDKDSKQRLKLFKCANNAITAASFNRDGSIFAYALGYDWSKGIAYAERQKNTQIFLHGVRKEEIEPRPKT